jgi:hypothetical protein
MPRPTFVELAAATGVSLDAMHRVTAVASGALDALPHNGAVITLLTVCCSALFRDPPRGARQPIDEQPMYPGKCGVACSLMRLKPLKCSVIR